MEMGFTGIKGLGKHNFTGMLGMKPHLDIEAKRRQLRNGLLIYHGFFHVLIEEL